MDRPNLDALPGWMRNPASSLAVDGGARIGVRPDRVVHVHAEGVLRPLSDWAVVAALGGAPEWWERADALQRALALTPPVPVADLVTAAAVGRSRRAEMASACEPGDARLALFALDRSERVAATAVGRLGGSEWERALLRVLALNPQVPWQVARALAHNPHTPDEGLVALAAIADHLIRMPLTDREQPLPVRAQEHLVADEDAEIREALGRSAGLAEHVAAALAADGLARVRETIARRVDCPPNALADLAVDVDPLVQAQALLRIRRDRAERAVVSSPAPEGAGRPYTWYLLGIDGADR